MQTRLHSNLNGSDLHDAKPHTHDDRYYTKAQSEGLVPSGVVTETGAQTISGVKKLTSRNKFINNNTDFGAGADGATGTYVTIGNLGTNNRVYVSAQGTPANIPTVYQSKGTGTHEFNAAVLLPADPTLALQAATKQYTDVARKVQAVSYTIAPTGTDATHNTTGTSDQTIFNTVGALLASTGGKIFIRRGNYSVSHRINLYSNVTYEFEPGAVITKGNGANQPVFMNVDPTNGNHHIIVRGATVIGNYANNPSNPQCFNLENTSYCIFENITITGCSSGFRNLTAFRNTYINIDARYARENSGCFGFERNSCYNFISNCYTYGYTLSVNFDGYAGPANHNVLHECFFETDITPENESRGDCILIINGSSHNVISNTVVRDFEEDAIRLSNDARFNTITGCTIYDIGRYGIVAATRNFGNVIIGNTIDNTEIGIIVDELGEFHTITGNTVGHSNFDGIVINIHNNANNIVSSNIVYASSRYGIYFGGSKNQAIGNMVDNAGLGTHAIYLLNASRCTVMGNTAKNSTITGIRVQATLAAGASNNIISSNHCYDDQLKVITDASMTSGTALLNSPAEKFMLSDVGKAIVVAGAGVAGANLTATILSITDQLNTQIALSVAASTTVAAVTATIGTTTQQYGIREITGTYSPDYNSYMGNDVAGNTVQGIVLVGMHSATDAVITTDVEVTDFTKGVILKSPDGTRYRLTVANGGTPVFTAL